MTLIVLLLAIVVIVVGVRRQRQQARKQRQMMLHRLRDWLGVEEINDPGLQKWVNGLSAEEASVLLDLLNGYFASLNWEINWLFSPHLKKIPALQQAVEEGVLAYMRSILDSLQLVEDVRAYNTYLELVRKPKGRKQFSLIQKLYESLAAQKAIKPGKAKRGLFARRALQKEQIAAVLQVFDREPDLAMKSLKALLTNKAVADTQLLGVAPIAQPSAPVADVSTALASTATA